MTPNHEAGQGRLTVEMGVGAYQATGARPERGTFVSFARSGGMDGAALESACGIGVIVEAGVIFRRPGELHYEAAAREFGRPYAEGFSHGFDGAPMPREIWSEGLERLRMIEGYRDGRALWTAARDGIPSPVPDFPPAAWTPETVSGGDPAALQSS